MTFKWRLSVIIQVLNSTVYKILDYFIHFWWHRCSTLNYSLSCFLQWLITRDKYPPLILFILSPERNEILWELQGAILSSACWFLTISTISVFIYILILIILYIWFFICTVSSNNFLISLLILPDWFNPYLSDQAYFEVKYDLLLSTTKLKYMDHVKRYSLSWNIVREYDLEKSFFHRVLLIYP